MSGSESELLERVEALLARDDESKSRQEILEAIAAQVDEIETRWPDGRPTQFAHFRLASLQYDLDDAVVEQQPQLTVIRGGLDEEGGGV